MSSTISSTSTSTLVSTQQNEEISTVVPDKEKILSDLKAFMSHHEIATTLGRKKFKESEKKLTEAKVQIEKLDTKILDFENRAEILSKEIVAIRKSNYDLSIKLQTKTDQNGKLDANLKEKEEEIFRLKMEVEKLSEFKQKVELAERIFKTPIKNINLNINFQPSGTQLAISGPSEANDEGTENGAGTANGNGKETEKLETESESSNSERKNCTRGFRVKRGRLF